MGPGSFDIDIVGAGNAGLVSAVEKLAAHAAGYAGCGSDEAGAFAAVVAAVMVRRVESAGHEPGAAGAAPPVESVRVIVRCQGGSLEVLVACERRFESPSASDTRTSVQWTHEDGALMCRVARELTPGAEPDDLSETAQES